MSQLSGTAKDGRTERTDSLTAHHWRVIDVLRDRSTRATERELAAAIATAPAEDHTIETLQRRLHHVDLPKLAAAGLVEWNEADGTVGPTDHSALHDERVRRATQDPGQLDKTPRTGHSGRRRAILALLESQQGPKNRATLASEVAICEHGGDASSDHVHAVDVALHHVHLPKLAQAGILAYDVDDGTVTPIVCGHA